MNQLPAHASVVVIGGGIMGCSTLYHLAKSGVSDAILLERNQLTSGTTWHSAAQVRALRSTKNLTDLIRYSIQLYSSLEVETGQSTGWINKGSLSIATNQDRLTHIRRQQVLSELYGVSAQSVSVGEAKERWPHMNCTDIIGAVWSPDDGRVSPSDLCAAMTKGAQARGARIYENTEVVGIVLEGNRVKAVETGSGTVNCDAIALCTGLWSRKMGQMASVEVPVWPCEHYYLLTKPVPDIVGNLPTLSDHDGHLYIRDDSGGLLVGCFEPHARPVSPQSLGRDFAFQLLDEDWDHFEPMMVNAMHRLPALQYAEVKMLLNGPESFTPDGSFMLGESVETKGFFLGCGMNSVGVASSGGAGMALAHCIQHGHMPMDLHEANPARFPNQFNSVEFLTERIPEVLGKHYEIAYPGRQWSSGRNLKTSTLHEHFCRERAHFGQIFGWERPLYFGKQSDPVPSFGKPDWFTNVAREVRAAHENAAIFDQSTFGKIDVTGTDACKFLNRVCTNQINRPIGRVIYTTMLNERGGIESDFTVFRLGSNHFRLYLGTAFLKNDLSWLHRQIQDEELSLADRTDEFCVLGLMGPNAANVVSTAGGESLEHIGYFECREAIVAGQSVLASRLSYVGEFGWEITCQAEHASEIYSAFQKSGADPAGLYAQTSMRIEKRFLAFGHELDSEVSPVDSGLSFTVDWEKDFTGKRALEERRESGARNRFISVILDNHSAIPIGDEPVIYQGKPIGKTTSATFGYRVNAPVAISILNEGIELPDGTSVEVNVAGDQFSGTVRHGSAFDPAGARMKGG